MADVWRKIAGRKPYPIQLVAERMKGQPLLGRKEVPLAQAADTWEPLVNEILSGRVPYNADVDPAMQVAFRHYYEQAVRGKKDT